jgi:hypothetical protein
MSLRIDLLSIFYLIIYISMYTCDYIGTLNSTRFGYIISSSVVVYVLSFLLL